MSGQPIEADDGLDPRRWLDRRPRTSGSDRKARQLCEQVQRALSLILTGLADEVLRNLVVLRVEPAPHSGRLLVTVAGPAPADATDGQPASDHLARAAGLLRTEVAAAINRRKAPELIFQVASDR